MHKRILVILILFTSVAMAQQPVKIDQTTPGTTNAVAATNLPTTVDTNSGSKSASTLRVVLATDQPALTNKLLVTPDSVALPANQSVNVNQIGGTGVVADPCQELAKTYTPISLTANTKLLTGVSAKKYYVCEINLVVAAATNVAIVEGTGSTCGTSTAGIFGGATAATGWNFAANDGIVLGTGGFAIGNTATNADDLCLFVSAANQVSGNIVTVNF
jgi:hypothetical protein